MLDGTSSETVRSKKNKRKKSKLFLLTSKKCWVMDRKLLPFYQHLVDGYSVKLREELEVKVVLSDFEIIQHVKEEPLDDFFVEHPSNQVQNSTNQFKVIIPLVFCSNFEDGFVLTIIHLLTLPESISCSDSWTLNYSPSFLSLKDL